MRAGLITPPEEIPLFNGELEALLEETLNDSKNDHHGCLTDLTSFDDVNGLSESLTDIATSSPPSVTENVDCVSTSDESDSSDRIPQELQLLQQKISEGLVGCRWKAKYPQKVPINR